MTLYHNKKKRGYYKVLYSLFLVEEITEILDVLKTEGGEKFVSILCMH